VGASLIDPPGLDVTDDEVISDSTPAIDDPVVVIQPHTTL
jgi:hypothetical protein